MRLVQYLAYEASKNTIITKASKTPHPLHEMYLHPFLFI